MVTKLSIATHDRYAVSTELQLGQPGHSGCGFLGVRGKPADSRSQLSEAFWGNQGDIGAEKAVGLAAALFWFFLVSGHKSIAAVLAFSEEEERCSFRCCWVVYLY